MFRCCCSRRLSTWTTEAAQEQAASSKPIISPADLAKKIARGGSAGEQKPTPRPAPRGGVTKEIIGLYRNLLKETKTKLSSGAEGGQQSLQTPFSLNEAQCYIRGQFERNRNIPRQDVEMIQYHVHYAKSKLADLRADDGGLLANRTGFRVVSFGP